MTATKNKQQTRRVALKNPARRARRPAIEFYTTVASNREEGRLVPVYKQPRRERKPGDPLLVYSAGESPLERGLLTYH